MASKPVSNAPFADHSFDAALCQMALLFFPDRMGALREMRRVAVDRGTVAILVPARLGTQPAYGLFVEMVAHRPGSDAASLLSAYFAWGRLDGLTALVEAVSQRVTATSCGRS